MYHKLTIEETLETLDVNPETGLTAKEAKVRVAKDKSPDRAASFMGFLGAAFSRPSVYILLVAAALAIVFGEISSAFSILLITGVHILFTAIYSFNSEMTLDRAISTSVNRAIVLRNGAKMKIKADELVVGDVVTIKPGRVVPADIRLISSDGLVIDESSLTGFENCEKNCNAVIEGDVEAEERINCAFEGTVVVKGRGDGVVIATGMSTERSMLSLSRDVSEREEADSVIKLNNSSDAVSAVVAVFVAVTFFIGFMRKDALLTNVLTCVSLIAATVPYGVYAVVSGILASGAAKLKNLGFTVKSVLHIENSGKVSVLVTDMPKIGVVATYTNGRVHTPQEEDTIPFLDGLLLCDFKNPSLHEFAKSKEDAERVKEMFPRTGELSGEVTTTLHRAGKSTVSYSGGEPWDILSRSERIWDLGKVRSLVASDREEIEEAMKTFLDEGYSLTALGMRFGDEAPCDTGLIFLGIVATCAEANLSTTINTKELAKAGVRVYLLTEEDAEKARLGASALSLPADNMVLGREVSALSDEELSERLSNSFVFAGLHTRDKVRIVKTLKSCGKTVAAMGSRVSDAPVLDAADVGISDIHARDVAKNAADILLDGTTPPEEAILCGKLTRSNTAKAVTYIFAEGLLLMVSAFVGIISGWGFPLSAAQILLLSLMGDILAGWLIPKSRRIPAGSLHIIIYGVSALLGVAAAAGFKIFLSAGNSVAVSQWCIFGCIVAAEMLLLLPLCFSGRKTDGKRN